MIKNTEIEDFYSNTFNNYSVEPNGLAWDKIESNLNSDFAAFEYKAKFSNYAFNPTSAVWGKIATRLWFSNFVHFSYNSFNIYYAASIIFALIGSLMLLNNTNQYNSETITNNIVKNSTISNSNISNNNTNINNNSFISENNNGDNNKDINNSNNNNSDKNTTHPYNPEKTDTLKTNSKDNNTVFNNTKNNITPVSKTDNRIAENPSKTDEPIIITKYITDTLIIRDTVKVILRDTVFKDNPKDILSKGTDFSPWSIDAYYSPMLYSISANAPKAMQENIDTSYNSVYNWSLGLNANYKIKNFNIQAGITYTKYSEKFSYQEETITTNSYNDKRYMAVGEYTYVDKYTDWVISGSHTEVEIDTVSTTYELVEYELPNAIVIDTVWSYNIDSSTVIVMDSTEIVKFDTIIAIKYDSVKVVVVDTVKKVSFYDVINQYSYIEIPLMVGYEFNSKHKFSYVLNAGLVTGIFVNAKGKGVTLSNEIVDLNSLPFMKLNFTGIASAGVHYKFSQEMSFILEATYRKNFTSIYQSTYFMEKRFNSYGLRIGVKYRF